MFENEIKFISDFTLNKVKELGSFITVEKLLSTDIHPSIKKYLEGEIDYLISEDRKKLIENSLFDYSGKEISNYFDLIGAEIKKTKKISYEDIKNIILQAVSFNANYVVRPKWSLSKLIYGNSKTISINEIQLMFNYTYYFEYLNNVFLAYLSKKKILAITVTEFELIMNKIDRELFMLHQSKLVDNALYAIADYFSIGGLNKSSVSVEAVESFLKEKNLTELLFKLKRAYANSAKKKVDIDEIRKVLYSTLSIDSPFVEDNSVIETEVDAKHFENPLKDNFISEDVQSDEHKPELSETEKEFIPEDGNNEIRVTKQSKENVFVEDVKEVMENTDQILENVDTSFDSENVIHTDIEKALEQNEPQKFELENVSMDEINLVENDLLSESNFIDDLKGQIIPDKNENLKSDENGAVQNIESKKEEKTLNEEEFLTSLTEEIEKTQDDEIIILDDKEQEDLLNFYDNELEISIDDDVDKTSIQKNDIEINQKIDETISELEFEHELLAEDSNEDGVAIDKLDFEKDLPPVDAEKERLEKESLLKANLKKRSDDIFNYLSKKEIDKIIKNLFNSDSADFANTMEKISDCNTFDEANHLIENVFKYARIKPHSKDAKLLTDAVAKYFNMDR